MNTTWHLTPILEHGKLFMELLSKQELGFLFSRKFKLDKFKLLFRNFVPISLLVTLEVVKFL